VTPEEALERARKAAARGGYEEGPVSLDASPVTRLSETKLVEWSLIDPALERVYSTRRLGAPITFAKRALVRALRQYLGDAVAQESRYNALATVHILNLEDRVRDLEDRLARERDGGAGEAQRGGERRSAG